MKNSFQAAAMLLLIFAVSVFAQNKFSLGIRSAVGASAFRSHVAISIPPEHGLYAIRIEPAFSAGAGIAFAYNINSLISVAPELQYTMYRANGQFARKLGSDFAELNEAGAQMYALELPILVRLSIGKAFGLGFWYVEAGPQVGANLNVKIYSNSELKKPDANILAFGPSVGGGVNMNGLLLGLRGHFGVLEYAEKTKGYPWTAQVSLTKFFNTCCIRTPGI